MKKTGSIFRIVKRSTDIAGAVVLLVAAAPVCAAAALMVKAETPGPVFFIHKRTGKNGRDISVYKFRSMHAGSEELESSLNDDQLEAYYREYTLKDDPRVTKTGRLLRRTYLDELPQLYNILHGEMSLVGPRPITRQELEFYTEDERRRLLSVKPGLTGYWQVFGKMRATYQNGERKRMELFYSDHASAIFDLIILLLTPASALNSIIKKGRGKN